MSDETVGSVGEEAARLLAALQGWATDGSGDHAEQTRSEACRYCPVCQVISLVRGTTPEVRQHLSAAASSLMQAVTSVLATAVPDEGTRRRESSVEKIDLTNDEWEDD